MDSQPPPPRSPTLRSDADVADSDTAVTTQEGRWRAGVNRQAQLGAAAHQVSAGAARQAAPDAQAQRLAASRAAAEARTRKRKEREAKEQLDALAFAASDDEEADHVHEVAVEMWLQDPANQDAGWELERPRRERDLTQFEQDRRTRRPRACLRARLDAVRRRWQLGAAHTR